MRRSYKFQFVKLFVRQPVYCKIIPGKYIKKIVGPKRVRKQYIYPLKL